MRTHFLIGSVLALALAGCNAEPAAENESAQANVATNQAVAKAELPPCPFQTIHELRGSIEGGRLLVTGRVDLMMAGFKPQLTPRPGGSAVTLDLALVAEPQAGVSDVLRYERSGVPSSPRGEIYCGGERLATFDIINVG